MQPCREWCLVPSFVAKAATMSSLRTFKCSDFLKMAKINLDPLTETYALSFYLQYYVKWPEYFLMSETPTGLRHRPCNFIRASVIEFDAPSALYHSLEILHFKGSKIVGMFGFKEIF